MCAKAFLYSAAASGNPEKMKMARPMFSQKDRELYPLLAKKISRPYEKPRQVREEQLLSFLLAERNGWRGPLIDLFRKKYLAEALAKEKQLRRQFFGIHKFKTVPKIWQAKIAKIYHQELDYLV